MNNLVTSLELSKRLYEAGVTKKDQSPFKYYQNCVDGHIYIAQHADQAGDDMLAPALTLQELLEVMPSTLKKDKGATLFLELSTCLVDGWVATYSNGEYYDCDSEACFPGGPLKALEALANYLLDNDLM